MLKVIDGFSEIWKFINPCFDLSSVLTVSWPWLLTFTADEVMNQKAAFDFCLFSPLTPQIITDFRC